MKSLATQQNLPERKNYVIQLSPLSLKTKKLPWALIEVWVEFKCIHCCLKHFSFTFFFCFICFRGLESFGRVSVVFFIIFFLSFFSAKAKSRRRRLTETGEVDEK